MEKFVDLINQAGSPYSDISWVAILFVLTVVFSYLLAFLTEKKPGKVEDVADIPEEGKSATPQQAEAEPGFEAAAAGGAVQQEPSETTKTQEKEGIPDDFKPKPPPAEPDGEGTQDMFKPPVSPTDGQTAPEQQAEPEQVPEPDEPEISYETEDIPEEDFFTRLRKGLSRTHTGIFGKLDNILSRSEIDTDLWDDFEESLITADLGVATTMKLRENLESGKSGKPLDDPSAIKDALKEEIRKILKGVESGPLKLEHKPTIIMVAGANGVGKTTTIGKLANRFSNEGKKVMIAAGDTFRAAAVEQLEIWADRVGASFVKATKGADPSSVAFDAVQSSVAKGTDVLIIDTAGRLHTKTNLMDELSKIKRVVGNKVEGAPHEVLLVLDATTGQNAIQQAKTFKEAIDVSGIILTKLDGTSRGGVIVAIADELGISVKFIGIGEALDDLREFKADEFVEALFLSGEETVH